MPVIVEDIASNHQNHLDRGRGDVVVGLINNMPDGAIRATQQQFVGLLEAACEGRTVRLERYYLPQVPRAGQAHSVLLRSYAPIDSLWSRHVDGLIMTGNVPKAATLRDEPYWEEMARVFDWAEDHTASSVWSCLSAHAAVLHQDGVERTTMGTKLSGVFESLRVSDHALMADAPEQWSVPHSRQFGLKTEDLLACDYRLMTVSPKAGADIFIKQRRSLSVYLQGHMEYGPLSLFREYARDVEHYLNREREIYPEQPVGYFPPAAAAAFDAFEVQAKAERRPEMIGAFPIGDVQYQLVSTWREAAVTVYRNWLRYLAEQTSVAAVDRGNLKSQQPSTQRHGHG